MKIFLDTNVAPVRTAGMPCHTRRADKLPGARESEATTKEGDDTQSLHEFSRNLEGLSMGVSPFPGSYAMTHCGCAREVFSSS